MTKRLWMCLLVLACGFSGIAAAVPLEAWRGEVVQTRKLADSDARRAHAQAVGLEASIPSNATPADRVDMLNLLARTETYIARSESAEKHARHALSLAEKEKYREGQAEADNSLALVLVNLGKLDALPDVAARALSALEGVDRPDLLGEALLRAASMYFRIGLEDESATMTLQAAEIARRSKNLKALAYAEQGLAFSFKMSGNIPEAREHFAKMREYARAAGLKWQEADALIHQGNTTEKLGDLRGAEAMEREAVRLYREFGSPFGVNNALFMLAEVMQKQGRHAEAHRIFDEMVATYDQYPNRVALRYTLHARSVSHQALGRLTEARQDAERAYGLALDIGFPLYRSESAQRMAAVFAALDNHRRAYQYAVEAAKMTQKLEQEKRSARMLELARRYKVESKQREINELTSLNRLQASEIKQRELQRRLMWGGFGGGAVVLAGLAYFLYRQHRAKREIQALNAGLELRVQERTAELRQQANYLRTLIDALPMPVWFKDAKRRFVTVNQANAARFGHTVGEMTGKNFRDFAPVDLADQAEADESESLATRRPKVVERQINGQWREIYSTPVQEEDGTVLGIVGFDRDISQHKALEAAQAAALAEEKQLAKLRTEFMAQISHELRTPLNGILGYVQVLQRDGAMTREQLARLDIIRQSGDHLLALINNILDHANLDAEKLALQPGDISLGKFFHAMAGAARVKAEHKHLDFVLETAQDLPDIIRGDELRLGQVLLYLLDNAVKFTDQGQVSLRASFAAPSLRLRIEVRDTGIGIEEGRRESIFESFGRASSKRRWHGGIGLGLPISRKLARLMGGDLWVESGGDEGSVFVFETKVTVVRFQAAHLHGEAPVLCAALPVPLVAPPEHELESMHAWAQRGNMNKLAEQADRLAELGARYVPFAVKLRTLAKGYQSQAILNLIEEFRAKGAEH